MSIQPRTTEYQVPDDPSWLGSAHGLDATTSITLHVAAFTEATHYPEGFIRGGTPVGKITASGKYGPYDNAATDGREVLAGFVATSRAVAGQTAVVAALLDHGKVRTARLPIAVDAAGVADVAGRIQFI